MPTYESQCNVCDKLHNYISSSDDCLKAMPICCETKTTKKIFTAPRFFSPIALENYICPVTEKVVTSSKQKREIEIRNDLIIHEPGIVKNPKSKQIVKDLPTELKQELRHELKQERNNNERTKH